MRSLVTVMWVSAAVALILSPATADAEATHQVIDLGPAAASDAGATAVYDPSSGAHDDAYWQVGEGLWIWLEPGDLGLGPVDIGNVSRVRYTTYTGPTEANVDVAFQFYTKPDSDTTLGGNDTSWYQRMLKTEPLYSADYDSNFPDNTWNTFDSDHSVASMLWYDGYGHTNAGWYDAPTLADIEDATYQDLWSDIPNSGGDDTSYNYSNLEIKSFVLATSTGGNWDGFEGRLDQLVIDFDNGDSLTANFVPEPATMGLLGIGGLGVLIRRKRS